MTRDRFFPMRCPKPKALTLEQQADDSVEDSEIFKMTYDRTEKTLVSNAQANMISYHQKVLDLELKQKNERASGSDL